MSLSISVLYIHPVGTFGGASRSLMEVIRAFPAGSVRPHVITQKGTVADLLVEEDIPVISTEGISQFDCTKYGHYRGLRWLIVLRELYFLIFSFIAVLKARWRWKDIDIVHVNEITALVPLVLAKLLFKKPLVVHVRSVQQCDGIPLRRRFVQFVLKHFSNYVVAIDQTVRKSLPADISVEIVHNGCTVGQGLEASDPVVKYIRALPADGVKVAMIGNLLPMKGVYEFVEAAKLCWKRGVRAHFIIVGENARRIDGLWGWLICKFGFAHDVRADLERFVAANGLEQRVHLVGATRNIRPVYNSIDIVCFPSHLNAVGRPALEAAFSRVPSIVAMNKPCDDTFVDGETGICIESRNPTFLADAIEHLSAHPEERKRMGEMAYKQALQNFDIAKTSKQMLCIYERLMPQSDNWIGQSSKVQNKPGPRPGA